MFLNKDVLGLLIIKLDLKDVLNLRLSCKYYNDIILKFNKYWFSQVKSKVKIHKNPIEKRNEFFESYGCVMPLKYPIESLEINNVSEEQINSEVIKHPLYKIWREEVIKNRDYPEKVISGICRIKYLKEKYPNFKCPVQKHYHYPELILQTDVNILDEKISKYYDKDVFYFRILIKEKIEESFRKEYNTINLNKIKRYIERNRKKLDENEEKLQYYINFNDTKI